MRPGSSTPMPASTSRRSGSSRTASGRTATAARGTPSRSSATPTATAGPSRRSRRRADAVAATAEVAATASARRRLLLDGPAVAVGVAEEREGVPRAAVAVLPLAVLDEPDRRDVDAGIGVLLPGRIDVRDAELETLQGPRLHLRQPLADRDRAGGTGRRQLDDPEVV